MAVQTRMLKMGMIGIGVGGTEILPAMESMPEIDLYAGADINPLTRERFKQRYAEATHAGCHKHPTPGVPKEGDVESG